MVNLLIWILVLGVIYLIVEKLFPLPEPFMMLLRIVLGVILIVILLQFVGVHVPIPL